MGAALRVEALAAQALHFAAMQAVEFVERDASRKGLGGLPQQLGRCAAEDQEARLRARTVSEHAQEGEDLGKELDLVEDDIVDLRKSAEALKGLHIPRIF